MVFEWLLDDPEFVQFVCDLISLHRVASYPRVSLDILSGALNRVARNPVCMPFQIGCEPCASSRTFNLHYRQDRYARLGDGLVTLPAHRVFMLIRKRVRT